MDESKNPAVIDISARGTEKAEVVEVIKTTSTIGNGTPSNPTREQVCYWSFDGKLIAEIDPIRERNRFK